MRRDGYNKGCGGGCTLLVGIICVIQIVKHLLGISNWYLETAGALWLVYKAVAGNRKFKVAAIPENTPLTKMVPDIIKRLFIKFGIFIAYIAGFHVMLGVAVLLNRYGWREAGSAVLLSYIIVLPISLFVRWIRRHLS